MIIEGHFGGTRAKHYTDREFEKLREVYRIAYHFLKLTFGEGSPLPDNENYSRRLAEIEMRLERQRILEAKLTVLEDELDRMKHFRKQMELWKRP